MNKDISFHYTDSKMVQDLLRLTPIMLENSILDAGSGKNKVWYNNLINIRNINHASNDNIYECEIEDGNDFLNWNKPVDWVIGNPPFHLGWKFTQHASIIAQKGIAFLLNSSALNSNFIPKRLEEIKNKSFYLHKIHVCQVKRWYGRYYYVIFLKSDNYNFLTWETKIYE